MMVARRGELAFYGLRSLPGVLARLAETTSPLFGYNKRSKGAHSSRYIAMAVHRFLIAVLVLAGLNVSAPAKPIAGFTLADSAGKAWKLHEQKTKATVLVFLATECPM